MPSPRILFVSQYGALFGANRSLLALVDGLAAHGIESGIAYPGAGALAEEISRRGLFSCAAPVADWTASRATLRRKLSNLRWTVSGARRLRAAAAAWNPDLVYTNTSVTATGRLLGALLRRPHVWHLRELGDLDYGRGPVWGRALQRRVFKSSRALIAISSFVRDHLVGADARCAVIPNGVATLDEMRHHKAAAPAPFSTGRPPLFAIVGVVHRQKGQDAAIRALAMLPAEFSSARLAIVGEGDEAYTEECRRLAVAFGVADRVEWRGYVRDPFSVLREADALLMCSVAEGFGRVTAEAMATARPVIGLRAGGTPELVTHGRDGLLYEGGPDALAAAMTRLLRDPQSAAQLGEAGWRRASEEFTVETYAARVHAVIEPILRAAATRNGEAASATAASRGSTAPA